MMQISVVRYRTDGASLTINVNGPDERMLARMARITFTSNTLRESTALKFSIQAHLTPRDFFHWRFWFAAATPCVY